MAMLCRVWNQLHQAGAPLRDGPRNKYRLMHSHNQTQASRMSGKNSTNELILLLLIIFPVPSKTGTCWYDSSHNITVNKKFPFQKYIRVYHPFIGTIMLTKPKVKSMIGMACWSYEICIIINIITDCNGLKFKRELTLARWYLAPLLIC